jgi:hypothetical protein
MNLSIEKQTFSLQVWLIRVFLEVHRGCQHFYFQMDVVVGFNCSISIGKQYIFHQRVLVY